MPNPTPGKQPTPSKQGEPRPQTRHEGNPEGKAVTDVSKTPANVSATPKPAETQEKPVINWDALPPAVVDTGIAAGDRIDVMKDVPEVIRKDVEDSLAKFLAKLEASKPGARVLPVYLVKPLPDAATAKEYTRLAKRYGKYRPAGQLTVRGGPLNKDPKTVRFSAKPFEKRDEKSAAEKTVKPADKTDANK